MIQLNEYLINKKTREKENYDPLYEEVKQLLLKTLHTHMDHDNPYFDDDPYISIDVEHGKGFVYDFTKETGEDGMEAVLIETGEVVDVYSFYYVGETLASRAKIDQLTIESYDSKTGDAKTYYLSEVEFDYKTLKAMKKILTKFLKYLS